MRDGAYAMVGGFWRPRGPRCVQRSVCDDCDVCTLDLCEVEGCANPPRLFGDINGDGIIDIFDILHVLDGFAGVFVPPATKSNVDLAPCDGDGVIDIFDILAVLDGFAGVNLCACPLGP